MAADDAAAKEVAAEEVDVEGEKEEGHGLEDEDTVIGGQSVFNFLKFFFIY